MPMSIFQISKYQCQCQCQFSRDSQNQCQCQCQYLQKSQCQWVFQYYCSCLVTILKNFPAPMEFHISMFNEYSDAVTRIPLFLNIGLASSPRSPEKATEILDIFARTLVNDLPHEAWMADASSGSSIFSLTRASEAAK